MTRIQGITERVHAAAVGLLLLACTPAWAVDPCPPQGADRQALQQLQQRKFQIGSDAQLARLAAGLLPCLGNPDPVLRDDIAFAAYSTWMRGKRIDVPQLRELRDALYRMLDGDDAPGFRKPFAALTLSEVARTDRIEPWMSDAEREAMVQKAATYLQSVRDYRGFSPTAGWRHGVAHGSDWLMQLALNPVLQRRQLDAMLAAVASQIMPAGHAYEFGEPERLGRPVLYIAARGLMSGPEWSAWFAALGARLGDQPLAFKDGAWLARRHDLHAFLANLYVEADLSGDPRISVLKEPVAAALKQLP